MKIYSFTNLVSKQLFEQHHGAAFSAFCTGNGLITQTTLEAACHLTPSLRCHNSFNHDVFSISQAMLDVFISENKIREQNYFTTQNIDDLALPFYLNEDLSRLRKFFLKKHFASIGYKKRGSTKWWYNQIFLAT
jgi:hypothetical protein